MNSKSVKEGGIKSMYSKSKRFIASFLAVLMAVTMLPVNAVSVAYAEELSVPQIETVADAEEPVAAVEETSDLGNAEEPLNDVDLTGATVTLSGEGISASGSDYTAVYTGSKIEPTITVTLSSNDTTEDYTPTWNPAEIKNAGTYKLSLTSGTSTLNDVATLVVTPVALTDVSVTLSVAEVEAGNPAPTPTVTATVNGEANTPLDTADYDIAYKVGETEVNDPITVEGGKTVTVIVTCKGNYTGSATATYTVKSTTPVNEPVQLSDCTITIGGKEAQLDAGEYKVEFATEYDNAAIDLPAVAVKKGGTAYSDATDYEYVFKKVVADGDDTVIDNATGKIQSEGDYTVTISAKTGADSKLTGTDITVKFTVKKKTSTSTTDEYKVTGTIKFDDGTGNANTSITVDTTKAGEQKLDDKFSVMVKANNTKIATKSDDSIKPVKYALSTGGNASVATCTLKFTTDGPSKITVLYHPNTSGRTVQILDSKGTQVAIGTNASAATTEVLTLDKKGTYYLGAAEGSSGKAGGIYIYEVKVEEKDAIPVVTKKLSDATVKLSMTGWTDESNTWKAPYTEEAIVPTVKVVIDGTEVSADDIKNELDITYARKVGETEPTADDYKKVDDTTLDLIKLGIISVKVAAKTDSETYEGETTPVTYEIVKAAAPTVTTKSIAADVSKATTEQVSADSMPQEINLAEMFKFDSKYGTATFKNAQVNDASGAENNILASDPALAIDGTTLKFNTKATLPSPVKKATITVDAEFANYESATLTLEVTLSSKIEVTIEGITVAEKTYDGDAVVPTGTLVIKNGETEVTDNDLKQSLVYTYTDKDGNESNKAPKNAGEYTLTVSVPLENESYSGSSAQITVKINQAALTVTAKTREWTIGYSAPAASAPAGKEADWYEVTGLVNNETLEDLEASVAFTYKKGESAVTDWTTLTEDDEIVIVPAIEGLANYTATPVNAKLTVKKEAALKDNEHELNFTKNWIVNEDKQLVHKGDNLQKDDIFTVAGSPKIASANNSVHKIVYDKYTTVLKGDSNASIKFKAAKGSEVEFIVYLKDDGTVVTLDDAEVIKGSTAANNENVTVLGNGTPEALEDGTIPTVSRLTVYSVKTTVTKELEEHTIKRGSSGEAQFYYVKVTEPGGGSGTVTINAHINGAPEGAKVYFVPATGEPVEASSSSALVPGTDYSLVLKDAAGNVINGYTVTINDSSTYRPTAAGDVTINVAPVDTDKVAFTQLPAFTISAGANLATPHVGDKLTLGFTANDKADATKTVISWYRMNGTTKTELTADADDATGKTYTIKDTDVDGVIKADVTIKNTAETDNATKTAENAGKVTLVKTAAPVAYDKVTDTVIPSGRQIPKGTEIVLKSTDADVIYYTTNGKAPTRADTELFNIANPIVVDRDMTITAVAVKKGMAESETVKFVYTVVDADTVIAPYSDPVSGTYDEETLITLASDTLDAVIYYTVDGNDPVYPKTEEDKSTTKYTAPFFIDKDTTIKAIAVKENMTNSSMATFEFKIAAKAPVAAGYTKDMVVDSGTTVSLSSATAGAKIYFAQGNSESDAQAALNKKATEYSDSSKPVITAGKNVIAAYAQKDGASKSATVTFVYQIKLNAPKANVTNTVVKKGTNIILTADEGASIYYKTASSQAAAASVEEALYKNAIRIDADTYIWAVAKKGDLVSAPFEAAYTVEKDASGNPVVNNDGLKVELVNPDEVLEYTGKAVTPAVIVTNNSEPLVEGVDYTVRYTNNIKANTKEDGNKLTDRTNLAKVTVTGRGNLTGSAYTAFKIYQKDLGDSDVFVPDVTVQKNKAATLVLAYNGVKLTAKDYTVKSVSGSKDDTKGARATWLTDGTMILEGQGNFKGTTDIDIKAVDSLKKFKVVIDTRSDESKAILTYNGEDKKDGIASLVKVYASTDKKNENPLSEFENYMISWPANTTDAGAVKFSILGCGDYSGLMAKSVTIKPATDKNNSTSITITGGPWGADGSGDPTFAKDFVSTGVTFNDELSVSDNKGNDLTEGKDYKVAYSANKKSGSTARVTVSFLGNYKGNKAQFKTFTINKIGKDSEAFGDIKVKFGNTKPYTNAGIYKAPVYLSIDGAELKNSDFDIKYYINDDRTTEMKGRDKLTIADAAEYATVYVTIKGKGRNNFADDVEIKVSYNVYAKAGTRTVDLSRAKVEIYDGANPARKTSKLPYSGNEIELEAFKEGTTMVAGTYYVKVFDGTALVDPSQYEVEYSNNKNKGRATVIISPSKTAGATTAGCKTATFTIAANNLKALQDLLFQKNKPKS